MKAVVAAFNQEKALVGAVSVIANLRMELFEARVETQIKAALPALLLALYSFFAKLGMSYNKRIMITAKSRDYITEIPTKYLLLLATE